MNAPKQLLAAAITLALTGAVNAQGPVRNDAGALDAPGPRAAGPTSTGSTQAGTVPPAQSLDTVSNGPTAQGGMGPPEAGFGGMGPGGMGPGGMGPGGMGPGGMGPGGYIGPGQPPMSSGPPRPLRRRDVSWVYIDRPKPRKVGVHDIITVVVDEKSEVTQNTRFNRTRNAIYTAELREWLRINNTGDLDVAAQNSPGINGTLQSRLQSMGQGLSTEGMKYRIAATVVDILPNGTLILEAHKSIRTNTEVWDYSLTGRIRSEDVAGNNEVRSENIADLMISKSEQGKIYDSTKRGWLQRFYDFWLPF